MNFVEISIMNNAPTRMYNEMGNKEFCWSGLMVILRSKESQCICITYCTDSNVNEIYALLPVRISH